MKKEESTNAVEIFDDETIITLYDEENNPIDFLEIASIEYDGKFYELMKPVELIADFAEDDAVIFEYEVNEGSSDKVFKPVFDTELLEKVFGEYLKAAADFECGCGCGHDCEHDCNHDAEDDCDDECDCTDCDCPHHNKD